MVNILAFIFSSLFFSSTAQNVYQSNPLGYLLLQSPSGYLINVNLQGNTASASSVSSSNTGYMLIATYSPKTVLMSTFISTSNITSNSHCGTFMEYNCSDNSLCSDAITSGQSITAAAPLSYSLPYFTVQLGDLVPDLIQVPQASSAINISETTSTGLPIHVAELASSCQTSEFDTFGQGAYGIIGLANRNASDLFAIYINQTSNNAVLFQSNINFDYAGALNSPVLQLPTSYTNWIVSGATNIYTGQTSISFSSRNLIFDVNSNAIGLSADIFSSFLKMLSSLSITNCYGEYLPICSYSGAISTLPNITIGIGSQNITIPPQIYIKGYGGILNPNIAVTLNFKLIDSSRTGPCYVTENYSNSTIILDSNFMKYYFTVFNGGSSTIDLYLTANSTVRNNASGTTEIMIEESTSSANVSPNLTVIVVGSISGLALLGLGLWYLLYRRRHKPLASLSDNNNKPLTSLSRSTSNNNISEIILTTQRSAIFNQQLTLEL